MESVIPKMGNRKTKEILGEGENSEEREWLSFRFISVETHVQRQVTVPPHQQSSDYSAAMKTGSRSDVHLTEKQELGESLAKLQLKLENTVCLKEDVHWSDKCPNLKHVPDGTTIGPRHGMVCTMCGKIGGHPGRDNWEGRAEEKYCFHCLEDGLHWDRDCPISPYDDTDSQLCKPR
ncbi:unnamed protein product [Malus baccata var. baccata]